MALDLSSVQFSAGEDKEKQKKTISALGSLAKSTQNLEQLATTPIAQKPFLRFMSLGVLGNIFGIVVLLLAAIMVLSYYTEWTINEQRTPFQEIVVSHVDTARRRTVHNFRRYGNSFASSILGTPLFPAPHVRTPAEIITNTKFSLFTKKDMLADYLVEQFSLFDAHTLRNEELKKSIWMYAFLPEEVKKIVGQSSLVQSLLATQVVMFRTALIFYSFSDSFVGEIAQRNDRTPADVRHDLELLMQQGEEHIFRYVFDCSINPYPETRCTDANNFSLKIYRLLQDKLNQPSPPFSITLNNLNPQDNQLTFTLEITLSPHEEAQFAVKGIHDPHLFLMSMIVDLLRESRFILGDSINLTSVNVRKKRIRNEGQDTFLTTSVLTITVPVQDVTEREIFDGFLTP